MRLIIVSGLSGAGKSIALETLEDLGYYCVDNLPLELLPAFMDTTLKWDAPQDRKVAVGVDARGAPQDLTLFPQAMDALKRKGLDLQVLYLRASDEKLIQRYSETRRRHPLSQNDLPLVDAIESERRLLEPIADVADLTIDTSTTNIHQLRRQVRNLLHDKDADEHGLSVLFTSFAFKNGVPSDADFVFDARCLPNPHWIPGLRSSTGRDEDVVAYLEGHADVHAMLADIREYLQRWIPRFERGTRSYLTVAVGCTGGHHRSVYLVESLARGFADAGVRVSVRHRELS